jgi:ferredoxin
MLVINPEECIDCALCEPECPVNAIYSQDELPEDQDMFVAINRDLSKIWPNLNQKKDAPADADDWKETPNKRQYLEK